MFSNMKYISKKQWLAVLIITLILLAIDLLTKYIVINTLAITRDFITVLPFLHFVFVLNEGVSFSFLQGLPWIIILLISIVSLGMGLLLLISCYSYVSNFMLLSTSLLLAGGMGNIIDRFTNKGVTDFIYISYEWFHFPVFNIADCFITLSFVLLVLDVFFKGKNVQK